MYKVELIQNSKKLALWHLKHKNFMKKLIILSLYATTPLSLHAEIIEVDTPLGIEQEISVASSTPQAPAQQPSFQLPIDHSSGFAHLEFLYWKLDETGMDYAIHKKQGETIYNRPGMGPSDGLVGKVHQIDFDWDPGFRVGAGYRFANLWELSGVYTFYFTDDHDSVLFQTLPNISQTNPAAEAISPIYDPYIGIIIGAKSIGSFRYQVGDIELATEFSLPRNISLRFVTGPTTVFIKQKFHIKYWDNFGESGTDPNPGQTTFWNTDWKFSGGGVKIGMDSHWSFYKGLNLLFGGAFSSVYGSYENVMKANILGNPSLPVSTSPNGVLNDSKFKNERVVFDARLFAGLSWNYAFPRWNLELYANYELNTWFNLTDQYIPLVANQTFPTFRTLQTPPLNLQGIDLGAKFNF